MKTLRQCRTVLFVLTAFWYMDAPVPLLAAPMASCDVVCGPTVDCDTACNGTYYEEPWDTTCGAHYNGVFDGYCAGTCGDTYCNGAHGEDLESCIEDCGYCGDSICDTDGGETATNCYSDCGSCSDGTCSPVEVCSAGYECEADCGSCETQGQQCTPLTPCGSGDICNPQHYCVSPGERTCGGDPHGCCTNEIWMATPGEHCLPFYGCGICVPSGPIAP